ncbi:hypothetical protein E2C01_070478 [Portunus trituberculatus]|uniref:Uncharacterized protein n=1 Tax=Portunus trituberculatus TaxID=210409 RepID=A0A5B7I275_PORTR|nr:hypothetical protein [Portunus trituberculatus]
MPNVGRVMAPRAAHHPKIKEAEAGSLGRRVLKRSLLLGLRAIIYFIRGK